MSTPSPVSAAETAAKQAALDAVNATRNRVSLWVHAHAWPSVGAGGAIGFGIHYLPALVKHFL
jgi:ElaB/YqjD/DUF883 family membrane-anchored ribosome-binding protein